MMGGSFRAESFDAGRFPRWHAAQRTPRTARMPSSRIGRERSAHRAFLIGLARAFGGAIIFTLPLLMTMEMWWLGFHGDPTRLALFLALSIPLLVGLSHYSGFEETFELKDDIVDAFVACAVGFVAAAICLSLFGVLKPGMAHGEIIGKIAVQAVPGSIGALLAVSQFGGSQNEEEEQKERFTRYDGELFLMTAGAVFLALNVAPTDEMVLISYKMTEWHSIALALVSLLIMHAFVYAVEFCGQASVPPGTRVWSVVLRFTVPGYAIALLVSLYVLWTFGRTDGMSMHEVVMATVVLAFPAAIGAAAARIVI